MNNLLFVLYFLFSTITLYSNIDTISFYKSTVQISIKTNQIDESFNSKILFKPNDSLWISLQGTFGIEGARILSTKDSFFMNDNINNNYIYSQYSYIYKIIPIPISFDEWNILLLAKFDTSKWIKDSFDSFCFSMQDSFTLQKIKYNQQGTLESFFKTDNIMTLNVNFLEYQYIKEQKLYIPSKIKIYSSDLLSLSNSIDLEVSNISLNHKSKFVFKKKKVEP